MLDLVALVCAMFTSSATAVVLITSQSVTKARMSLPSAHAHARRLFTVVDTHALKGVVRESKGPTSARLHVVNSGPISALLTRTSRQNTFALAYVAGC